MPPLDAFGGTASFHHLGIAVHSIRDTAPELVPILDPIQKVSVAFLEMNGLSIELIEAAADDSPVSRSLRSGQRLQHVCFEVDDMEEALRSGRLAGFHPMAAPVPAVAFAGRRIAWVFHTVFGLVEILER
jgi:methylmalonyl-CoA/ethylmalonyl-CoA epimerase